jgi:hypothetical protein
MPTKPNSLECPCRLPDQAVWYIPSKRISVDSRFMGSPNQLRKAPGMCPTVGLLPAKYGIEILVYEESYRTIPEDIFP